MSLEQRIKFILSESIDVYNDLSKLMDNWSYDEIKVKGIKILTESEDHTQLAKNHEEFMQWLKSQKGGK